MEKPMSIKLSNNIKLHPSGAVIYNRKAIIADLHIGLEENALTSLRVETKHMLERIKQLKEEGIEELILNGDVKHSFGKETLQEWEEIRLFVSEVKKMGINIKAVRGNHDNYLANILQTDVPEVLKINNLTITHGHKDIEWDNIALIGNEHPALKIKDELGHIFSLPCFVVYKNLIVIPSFNPLVKGTDVREWLNRKLSPILNKVKIEEGRIYAIYDWKEILPFPTIGQLTNITF